LAKEGFPFCRTVPVEEAKPEVWDKKKPPGSWGETGGSGGASKKRV